MAAFSELCDRLLPGSYPFTTLLPPHERHHEGKRSIAMQNPLDSLWGTVIVGVILTVILYYIVKMLMGG